MVSGGQSQLQRWHQLRVRLEFMPQQDVGNFAGDGDGRQPEAQMGKIFMQLQRWRIPVVAISQVVQ